MGCKKIVHKPAAPLYAAAAAWVLYALLFPLYRPGHFVIALAASAVVYGIARLFCKDIVEEVPQEPETTGNQELDQMIAQGKGGSGGNAPPERQHPGRGHQRPD